jgi:hypothetical protein
MADRPPPRTNPLTRDEVWVRHFTVLTAPADAFVERAERPWFYVPDHLAADLLAQLREQWRQWVDGPIPPETLAELQQHADGFRERPSLYLRLPPQTVLIHWPPVSETVPWLNFDYCLHCFEWFVRLYPSLRTRFCSATCSEMHERERRADRVALGLDRERWQAQTEKRAAERAEKRRDLRCQYCGSHIDAQRSTARFCSPRCRVAAHREARTG